MSAKFWYCHNFLTLAPLHGFEPRLTDPESIVLPLDDKGINGSPSEDRTHGLRFIRATI
jgi:hypothetical protein